MAAMQSLNLSGDSKKSDGRLKSLFWPSVESAWDVDYLGQQGFWICAAIAIINFAFISLAGFEFSNPATRAADFVLGLTFSFVFFVGGMGVRESSWSAAVMIFTLYVFNQLAPPPRAPGILSVIFAGVLLSNVRATFLASRWKPTDENEDRPTRFSETFRDKLVDQVPPKLWPVLKIPFFLASSLLLILLAYMSIKSLNHRKAPHANDKDSIPSVTVTASPADGK